MLLNLHSKLEKDILLNTYIEAGASTEDYTQGVFVYYAIDFMLT